MPSSIPHPAESVFQKVDTLTIQCALWYNIHGKVSTVSCRTRLLIFGWFKNMWREHSNGADFSYRLMSSIFGTFAPCQVCIRSIHVRLTVFGAGNSISKRHPKTHEEGPTDHVWSPVPLCCSTCNMSSVTASLRSDAIRSSFILQRAVPLSRWGIMGNHW